MDKMRSEHWYLSEIRKMLPWKKGKTFMAKRLRISEQKLDKLISLMDEDEENKRTPYLTSERVTAEGDKELQFKSNKPLSKEEIEKLYKIDNITSKLSSYWNKATGSGKYLVSANIKCITPDMSLDALKDKLKDIFPKVSPISLPKVKASTQRALMILISDDHCGMINDTNNYKSVEYNQQVYTDRLLKIVNRAASLGKFDLINVISLGDQMNGWNQQTTRGGHIVKSVSNEKQFEMYTRSRVAFYNALFSSGIASSYHVHEVNNSNHAGLGLAYMANQFLALYIANKFPEVKHTSHYGMISQIEYGEHLILITHGKDEKYQTRALPYSINDKTDAYIMEYLNAHGYNTHFRPITLYKGDLHTYGIQQAKFGRYVNVPAISGNSDYGDLNFGNTKAGALLEIFDESLNEINTTVVWM